MSKLRNLVIGLTVVGVCLLSLNTTSSNQNKLVKSGYMNLCEPDQKGNVRVQGIVQSVTKDTWTNQRVATLISGSNLCSIRVKFNPTEAHLLKQKGSAVEALVKLDGRGFSTLLNNDVKLSTNVVDEFGQVQPSQTEKFILNKSLVNFAKENRYLNLEQGNKSKFYTFTPEALKNLSTKSRWTYEKSGGDYLVTEINPIN